MESGTLAGYPMVDVRVELTDGKYHETDSSTMAFEFAGSIGFKEACSRAGAVLLEPIQDVEVTTPEEYMGEVMGDLSSRRGRIEGMEQRGNAQIVRAGVPLSELFGYATALRSLSQGRANYSDAVLAVRRSAVEHRDGGRREGARRGLTTASRVVSNVSKHQHTTPVSRHKREHAPWPRKSSSGTSRTSTSAPSVTSTMARRR